MTFAIVANGINGTNGTAQLWFITICILIVTMEGYPLAGYLASCTGWITAALLFQDKTLLRLCYTAIFVSSLCSHHAADQLEYYTWSIGTTIPPGILQKHSGLAPEAAEEWKGEKLVILQMSTIHPLSRWPGGEWWIISVVRPSLSRGPLMLSTTKRNKSRGWSPCDGRASWDTQGTYPRLTGWYGSGRGLRTTLTQGTKRSIKRERERQTPTGALGGWARCRQAPGNCPRLRLSAAATTPLKMRVNYTKKKKEKIKK